MNPDVIIIGAGPAGLCFARSLAGSGLAVTLIEREEAAALECAPFDGREIALTHHSMHLLGELGIRQRIPRSEVHALRDAQVLDGDASPVLRIEPVPGDRPQLGWLIANHLIRRAAFAAVAGQAGLELLCGRRAAAIAPAGDRCAVTLSDGTTLSARLVVAADSRFSETRRAMGIAADMHDFGRTMLVCRMAHEVPHRQIAWEWFGRGQTLALLPLAGQESSVVVTLPHAQIARLVASSEGAFASEITSRFRGRLGQMRLTSTRHGYPLVGVYPRRFVAARYALIGDAAVGMHPVTAHGFNFGLLGQDLLAGAVRAGGGDIGAPMLLAGYERAFRRATRPLFLATAALAQLYTDDRLPARVLRHAALAIGAGLPPVRRALARSLMQSGDSRAATRPLLGLLRALRP